MSEQPSPPPTASNGISAWRHPARTGAIVGVVLGVVVAVVAWNLTTGMSIVEATGTVVYWAVAGALVSILFAAVAGSAKRRRLRFTLAILVTIPLFWLCGDLFYSLLMRRCYANWDAAVERDAGGVRAGCQELTIGTGDTALLLIHGFADSPAVYQRMAPALADRGFTCRVMRLPHFATSLNEFQQCSCDDWRGAVDAELRSLKKSHSRVIVVAHSMGGAVAVDYLADCPDAAAGLVLLAPLLDVSNQRSPVLPAKTWYAILDHGLLFTDRIGMALPRDFHDPDAAALIKQDEFIPRPIYRELFALVERNQERNTMFPVPVFMALSDHDPVIDNAAAERFYEKCAVTPLPLKRMPEAGHVLPIDTGWDELVGEIALFARKLP